jgi:hypothetical protein
MWNDAEGCPRVHQKTPASNLIQHVDQDPWGDGVKPPWGP